MTGRELVTLCITSGLGLLILMFAILLLTGRGASLIAGYNTMSKEEKEKYDEKALCKFMGKILIPIGILVPVFGLGLIYEIPWITPVYVVGVVGLVLFAGIYANTGNRFKK
jgi:hypothetical protein